MWNPGAVSGCTVPPAASASTRAPTLAALVFVYGMLAHVALCATSEPPTACFQRASVGPVNLETLFDEEGETRWATEHWKLYNCSQSACNQNRPDSVCDILRSLGTDKQSGGAFGYGVQREGSSLQQYKQFRSAPPAECRLLTTQRGIRIMSFAFSRLSVTQDAVSFFIQETFKECSPEQVNSACTANRRKPSALLGGSSFEIKLQGPTLVMCQVADLFNSTYLATCILPPLLQVRTYRWKLSVTLMYVGFSAFYNPTGISIDNKFLVNIPFHQPITSCTIQTTAPELRLNRAQQNCTRSELTTTTGHWYLEQKLNSTSLRWQFSSGCVLLSLPALKRTLKDCIATYPGGVHIYGASHTRYLFDAMYDILGGNLSDMVKKHSDMSYSNVSFHGSNFASQMNSALSKVRQAGSISIVQSGSWDLWGLGIDAFISTMTGVLRQLKLLGSNNSDIIWLQTPPLASQFGHQGLSRNNFLIEAAHAWLLPQLRDLGIAVVPYYEIALPRQTESACGLHYMCTEKNGNKLRLVQSEVGDTVLQTILHALCAR